MHLRPLPFALSMVSIMVASLVACGGGASGPGNGDAQHQSAFEAGCVDFTVSDADLACATDSDCSFIDALRVCPGDPSCGGELPVNVGAAQRYARAVAGVPRTQVECGAPTPVRCIASKCALKQ